MSGAYWSPSDPVLVTLARAKAHLNVSDALHDDDIQQKISAASAAIRDYLKDRNDPTWTDTTVPPFIAQAVLLLLGNLYEHRGDVNDASIWDAIGVLCRRSTDPAIA